MAAPLNALMAALTTENLTQLNADVSVNREDPQDVADKFLADHPDVAAPLNALMAALTTEKLTQLNAQVAVDRQKPEDVAAQFLSDNGLG